jgi:hypothetical protein
MDAEPYIPVLKRVGWVLFVVGALDIGLMIYCVANRISYSSGLNVFAVVAGTFLLRGSLRTAAIVRWFATFYLSTIGFALVVMLAVVPLALALTTLRLYPVSSVLVAGAVVIFVLFAIWVVRELSTPSVQSAIAAARFRWRSVRVPVLTGCLVVAVIAALLMIVVEDHMVVGRATSLARHETGPGYSFFVDSVHVGPGANGTIISAEVIAWNRNEIRKIPVSWTE